MSFGQKQGLAWMKWMNPKRLTAPELAPSLCLSLARSPSLEFIHGGIYLSPGRIPEVLSGLSLWSKKGGSVDEMDESNRAHGSPATAGCLH